MDTVTLSKQNRLFWLGRYAERAHTTIQYMMKQFDLSIDGQPYDYHRFCRQMGIPCVYESEEDFCRATFLTAIRSIPCVRASKPCSTTA